MVREPAPGIANSTNRGLGDLYYEALPGGLGNERQNVSENYTRGQLIRQTFRVHTAKRQAFPKGCSPLTQYQRAGNHVVKGLLSLRGSRHDVADHQC